MDILNNINKQECFVNTLARLRESSKSAVVSADFADPYTMYMHVDRPVQEEFISILEKTYNTNHAELILLCGSVGDGKSHMLSYCNDKYPDMMDRFYVHNDSTASLYIDKPASYTIMKLMEEFSDEKIESSTKKMILAINLGTLSNFLEADKESRFLKLKRYVENAGILDEKVGKDGEDKYFHSVNFADYHLYELSREGTQSSYMQGILEKITQQDEDNDFYRAYCNSCKECPSYDMCPIRANYELLFDKRIQRGIINVLIECIVKNKLIVSTRSLLNMIYEILVDEKVFDRGSLEPRKEPQKLTSVAYCEALLPNTLFGKKNASEILENMNSIDPMQIRNEDIDDYIVFYENADDTIGIFSNDLGEYSSLLKRLEKVDFSDLSMHTVKEAILKLFIRLCWLTDRRKDLLPNDEDYVNYMKAIYAWNTGDFMRLKNVYGIVEKGVLAWNGYVEKNEMQLATRNKMSNFHLIQKIQIKQVIDNLPKNNEPILYSFRDELRLKYKYNVYSTAELDVDYALFSLLRKVLNGYVPCINDKRVNIKCVEFINKISQGGLKMEQLYIRDLSKKESKEYIIEFDENYGYSFEVN